MINPWRRINIKSKLMALMIIVVVIPLPGAMLAIDSIVSKQFEKTGRERVENATDTVEATLDETTDKLVSYMELMMRDHALIDAAYYAMVAGERSMLFEELRKTYKVLELDNLQVVNRSGILVTAGEYYARRGSDLSGHPIVRAALSDRTGGDIFYAKGRYVLQAAAPLRRERIITREGPYALPWEENVKKVEYEVFGAILGGVYIDKGFLEKIRKMSGAQLSVLTNGRVTLSTLPSLVGRDIDGALAGAINTSTDTVFREEMAEKTPLLTAYLPLRNRRGEAIGALQVALDVSDIHRSAAAARMSMLGIMFLSMAGAVVLAYFMAGGITKPVRRLQEGATRIGKGEFGEPITVRTGDELESLAGSFNSMAEALKMSEAELKEKHRQMLLAERHASLGRVAAHVAHEVGNPLTSISSFVQMLQKRRYDPFTEEALETIFKHIERISNIVAQLTGLARPVPEGPRRCSLSEVVEDSLEILRYDKRMSNVEVGTRDMSSLPMAAANSDQLQQVFVNLILNAAEAMPDGGRLSICGTVVPRDALPPSLPGNGAGYVRIDFSDTGCGVPPERIGHIFEPFYSSKNRGAEGAGLGLALSHGIVRRFNGELTLNSTSQGSTFMVYLPVAK